MFYHGAMAGGSGRGHRHPVPPVPPARQHCWVTRNGSRGGPHPALLVEWQQRDTRWWARVVFLVEADGLLVEQWLPADRIQPIGR